MLSINQVSYKDTKAFADEVRLVVERDWERVFSALTDWALLGQPDDEDAYASFAFSEPVRPPSEEDHCCRRRPGGRKRKEVK